jgi:hypothetical protein
MLNKLAKLTTDDALAASTPNTTMPISTALIKGVSVEPHSFKWNSGGYL